MAFSSADIKAEVGKKLTDGEYYQEFPPVAIQIQKSFGLINITVQNMVLRNNRWMGVTHHQVWFEGGWRAHAKTPRPAENAMDSHMLQVGRVVAFIHCVRIHVQYV